MTSHEPRILPFVPVDRDRANRDLDQELVDSERAEALANMAAKALYELYLDRIIRGEIEP